MTFTAEDFERGSERVISRNTSDMLLQAAEQARTLAKIREWAAPTDRLDMDFYISALNEVRDILGMPAWKDDEL